MVFLRLPPPLKASVARSIQGEGRYGFSAVTCKRAGSLSKSCKLFGEGTAGLPSVNRSQASNSANPFVTPKKPTYVQIFMSVEMWPVEANRGLLLGSAGYWDVKIDLCLHLKER